MQGSSMGFLFNAISLSISIDVVPGVNEPPAVPGLLTW
jgi:hypothetical protein